MAYQRRKIAGAIDRVRENEVKEPSLKPAKAWSETSRGSSIAANFIKTQNNSWLDGVKCFWHLIWIDDGMLSILSYRIE